MMQPGRGDLVNTSRGGTVNEEDLYEALKSGPRWPAAAMDVVESASPCPGRPSAAVHSWTSGGGHPAHGHVLGGGQSSAVSLICAENAAALLTGAEMKFVVK